MLPFQRLQKSNTTDNLWYYILILLKKRNLYGYEIPKLIKERFNFKPGKITPYRVLYRLESENFVKSKIKDRKRTYQITEEGKDELERAGRFYERMLGILE